VVLGFSKEFISIARSDLHKDKEVCDDACFGRKPSPDEGESSANALAAGGTRKPIQKGPKKKQCSKSIMKCLKKNIGAARNASRQVKHRFTTQERAERVLRDQRLINLRLQSVATLAAASLRSKSSGAFGSSGSKSAAKISTAQKRANAAKEDHSTPQQVKKKRKLVNKKNFDFDEQSFNEPIDREDGEGGDE
jgi:hypothetical protein